MPVQNYENLDVNSDVTSTRTLLHEVIPLTGTIVSGTYGRFPNENNIKNYSHGMFQSVFDYPFLSSSANHIFDLTVGYDETSPASSSAVTQNAKKINLYNQMAQLLLGYTGSTTDGVRKFEADLQLDGSGSILNAQFINFSRLLTKDQIKKGSFSMTVGVGTFAAPFSSTRTFFDISASATQGTVNTVGGDYGVLIQSGTNGAGLPRHVKGVGVIFYQAGIVALNLSGAFHNVPLYNSGSSTTGLPLSVAGGASYTAMESIASASISGNCDVFRRRLQSISYNNTTEINSKIYFCRVPHNKFNYSSNPTYTSGSKIVVKEVATDNPVSYITTIGLYSADNQLLATAKLSEPLKKTPSDELTLRVRLDY